MLNIIPFINTLLIALVLALILIRSYRPKPSLAGVIQGPEIAPAIIWELRRLRNNIDGFLQWGANQ